MTSSLYSITRNPLSLYLRFVFEATRNAFKYKDFRQGYMSRVLGCEIEPHVRIFPESFVSNCRIGRYSYVAEQTKITYADIGKFCSIGPGCRIGLGMHPTRGFVSTSPVFFSTAGQTGSTFVAEERFRESSRVEIGNDVWIGANATIVDGVRIGNGAILGAGAVVVSDVADYSVVGGVPARFKRLRFTESEIAWLMEFRWWDRDERWIIENYDAFMDIKQFIATFNPLANPSELRRPYGADSAVSSSNCVASALHGQQ
jgi:acetyltransferase-like isoleucine patch superfamily enzyme